MKAGIVQRRIVYWVLGLILFIVALESVTEPPMPKIKPAEPDKPCKGEAIVVDYPYEGGFLDPWECQIQCTDKKQRFILYTNGVATPCSDVPRCLDEGEDNGVTCIPPNA